MQNAEGCIRRLKSRSSLRLRNVLAVAFILTLTFTPFSANSQLLVRVSEREAVYQGGVFGAQVWYVGANGVRRAGSQKVLLADATAILFEFEQQVWAGTASGIYRARNNKFVKMGVKSLSDIHVTAIETTPRDVWIGTRTGLFSASGPELSALELHLPDCQVRSITYIRESDQLWVNCRSRVFYKFESDDSFHRLELKESEDVIRNIISAGGYVWITTRKEIDQPGPCHRIDIRDAAGDPLKNGPAIFGPVLTLPETRGVISVEEISRASTVDSKVGEKRNSVWLATTKGVYEMAYKGRQPSYLGGPAEVINVIKQIGDEIWLGTSQRAYRWDLTGRDFPEGLQDFPNGHSDLGLQGIFRDGDSDWVWGETGLYVLEESATLEVVTSIGQFAGMYYNFDTVVQVEEVTYSNSKLLEGLLLDTVGFEAIIRASAEELSNAIERDEFEPAETTRHDVLRAGTRQLHLAIRDSSGNMKVSRFPSVVFLPAFITVIILVVGWALSTGFLKLLFSWTTSFLNLVLSPVPWFMALVNSGFTRNSSGFMSFFVTFPWVRIWLLLKYRKRFLDSMRSTSNTSLAERKFSGASDVEEADIACLENILWEARGVQMCCRNDMERQRYLKYIAKIFCFRRICGKKYTPIYLSLRAYLSTFQEDPTKENLIEAAVVKLINFGDLSNKDLCRALLDSGRFLFLLDGLQELDAPGRIALHQFIDQFERENIIVIGTTRSKVLQGTGGVVGWVARSAQGNQRFVVSPKCRG